MRYFFGYGFAYRCWRAIRCGILLWGSRPRTGLTNPKPIVLAKQSFRQAEVLNTRVVSILGSGYPIDVCVGTPQSSHFTTRIVPHVLQGKLPVGSFITVDGESSIASPELCALQACQSGDLITRLELLMELCGTYSLPTNGLGSAVFGIEAATTSKSINRYLRHCKGRRGHAQITQALPFVLDNSDSPRETEVALVITLPPRYGGYGFTKPKLNHVIAVSSIGGQFTTAPYYVVDELWEELKVIVEYDSDTYHLWKEGGHGIALNEEKVRKDRQRHEALEAMGYTVITITSDHTRDYEAFDRKMHQLAKALGGRLRKPSMETEQARRTLQKRLFNPSHHTSINDWALDGRAAV